MNLLIYVVFWGLLTYWFTDLLTDLLAYLLANLMICCLFIIIANLLAIKASNFVTNSISTLLYEKTSYLKEKLNV